MGHRIIKVVQSLQALREQRAADVERASERGQNHTGVPFTLSLSKTPVAGPALARRAARARTPPGPSGSCSSTGRHPTRSRGIGRRRRDRQSGGHRRLSNEHVDDEILCAVVVAARGVEGIQNKRKREERNWNVRCKGMDVPGELAAGLAVPTQATCGIASPKVVLFLISNVSCQKWHHLDFLCPFLLLLKIDRSIRVSTMRYSKKRFLLCRPKNLPCAHQA